MPQERCTTELLEAFQSGDGRALDAIAIRHLPYVRRIVGLSVGRPVARIFESDDVVQDTMVSALRGLDATTIRSGGQLRAWLAQIVENRLRDIWRRAGAEPRRVSEDTTSGQYVLCESLVGRAADSPEYGAELAELEARLEVKLLSLTDQRRRVVAYYHIAGMSYEEIATALGYGSAAAVRATMARAMLDLTDDLQGP